MSRLSPIIPFRLHPVVTSLLAVNIAVFLVVDLGGFAAWYDYALWPPASRRFELWQLLTYGFLHTKLAHLAANMLALAAFGFPLERFLGARRFIAYYLACIVFAGAAQVLVMYLMGAWAPTIGASGGTLGLLIGYALLFPKDEVVFIFPPMIIKARWLAIGYALVELVLALSGHSTGVAHHAHLGGMLMGFLLVQYWRGRLPVKPRHAISR